MRRIALILAALLLLGGCGNADALLLATPTPEPQIAEEVLSTPALTAMPEPTPEPTLEPTPEPTPAPTPEPTPKPTPELPLSGYIIGVDPGHQEHSNRDLEPVAPGASEKKKKVSSGTQGRWTGVPEYVVNLEVGLLLRDLLEAQGATVIMTRTTHDVDISNAERAQLFNEYKTDYAVRLHCNGSENEKKYGAFMLVPTENPFQEDCELAAELLIDAFCEETGAKNLGLTWRSDQTGFNWCERMIVNIEMGHMTCEAEDYLLTDPDYQKKMAQGICDGILAYFEAKEAAE